MFTLWFICLKILPHLTEDAQVLLMKVPKIVVPMSKQSVRFNNVDAQQHQSAANHYN